jgi:Mg-chelatase subunit ChlD
MLIGDGPAHGRRCKPAAIERCTDDHPDDDAKIGPLMRSMVDSGVELLFAEARAGTMVETYGAFSAEWELARMASTTGAGPMQMRPPIQLYDTSARTSSQGFHMVFVLDESGSMSTHWDGVVRAYAGVLERRVESTQGVCGDIVSVVQFASRARTLFDKSPIETAPRSLTQVSGGTNYCPALSEARPLLESTPPHMTPLLIFMTDGEAHDKGSAVEAVKTACEVIRNPGPSRVQGQAHIIAFNTDGAVARGSSTYSLLVQMAAAANDTDERRGEDEFCHDPGSAVDLFHTFQAIVSGADQSGKLVEAFAEKIGDELGQQLLVDHL